MNVDNISRYEMSYNQKTCALDMVKNYMHPVNYAPLTIAWNTAYNRLKHRLKPRKRS